MPNDSLSDPRSDAELAGACNAGDAGAFEALYRRHRDWVVRLAHRITGNDEDALDVLQDTFAYVLGKLPRLALTARMTTFLYPVVKHLALSKRHQARENAAAADDLAGVAAPPRHADNLADDDLSAALSALPENQRETLLMRAVDGMSLEEIAAALALPVGTVKSRLSRACAALRADVRTKRYFAT